MSSFLYGLGRSSYRHRLRVVLLWLAVLVVLGGASAAVSKGFDENFSLPGTESQTALDSLNRTFPQAGGTTAQMVVVPRDGQSVRSTAAKKAIDASAERLRDVAQVDTVSGPFDEYAKGQVASDDSAAIIKVTFAVPAVDIGETTFDELQQQRAELQTALPGSQVSVGGDAYTGGTPGVSWVEAIGVVVALIVLWLTLGSLRAAGMPLVTALLGVGLTVALIFGATGFATVSSTTPLLALMLGLAVGIDYALFITSRHRDQLRQGMDPEESVAQAVATAGSAVVFAGMTVMIALVGLSVAGIPFLSIMGVAAAVGVAIAVLIALTLLPALLGFLGARLRPKVKPPVEEQAAAAAEQASQSPARAMRQPRAARAGRAVPTKRPRVGLGRRWVRVVTRFPLVTVLLVLVALGAMAYPAKDLRIALPSNGTADAGSPARVTYDLVAEHFGQGYNGPLIVTATIVGSDDPLGVMDGMADELRTLPGVASVPLATPNEDADTGIIQVIPEGAPDSQETKQLVRDIRALEPHFQAEYGVATAVTGFTAVGIDISDRLGAALLPFGILVVGLSLVLLTMVFRSIWVPVKATVGFLLSVGAAFGATAMVFEYGWFGSVFNVHQTAPVISFLPILLMGILFGLAMDYEVFLVSRMREEYVHGVARAGGPSRAVARSAVEEGFVASSRVVVAAAVIMLSVFGGFVPDGEGPIKTIGFGLAVGVFVDAFVVRMTLVPAVLTLLGTRAWWLPRWIDRRLPSFDVEGEGLHHQVALASWPSADDHHLVLAEGLRVGGWEVSTALPPGETLVVEGPASPGRTALLLTLAGRMRLPGTGEGAPARVKVAGFVLPEQAGRVRRRTAYVDCAATEDLARELAALGRATPDVLFLDRLDALAGPGADPDARAAVARALDAVAAGGTTAAVVAVADAAALDTLLRGPRRVLDLRPRPALAQA
ncbi:MMPL family transporter [Microlunatus flavus]|uniref:Putative drug exporter of the RND superfamily n=1 Tax=Microlunatus flavus TaxID=1036181 RepID=A0A1H9AXX2_9ACTN|nr:MMPL family transporter [Microlunatus flavus]SEP81337.1 putative drug exporter of the RND superfamily [Microlunatus flavus]